MPDQSSALTRFFGYMMIAVGILVTLLSGGCTIVALYTGLTEKNMSGMIGMALLFGLPFIAIGVGLFIGGRVFTRRRGPHEPPGKVF